MDTFTGESNSGSQTLQVTSGSGGTGGGGTIGMLPKFLALTLVYAPPGNQSSNGFTDTASVSVTATIADTFAAGTSVTFTTDNTGSIPIDTAGATFGFTRAVGLSQSFSDMVSSSQGSQVLSSSDFVNHYQDRFFLWLNPEFVVTQTGSNSGTFTLRTPLDSNGQPEPADVLDVTVADLLNPSQIPLEKLEPRIVDGVTLPGLSNICANPLPPEQCTVTNACGCTASDFATIVKQDPLVFPITGSSGQIVSADSAPSAVDSIRFVRVNQADPFLDGGSGVRNTFTLNDSSTASTTASEQVTITQGVSLDKKFTNFSDFNLTVRDQSTITITETASLGVSASVSHTATVTLGSSTSGCDENTDVWEDVLFHTFILVPAESSPAPCGTQDGDFLFSASPSVQSIPAGGSTSFGVYALGMFGFTGDEALSVAGTPPGATSTFVTSPIHGTGAAALQIQTSNATPSINYPLTVTGTSQGLTHSLNLTLRVTDFTLAASPASQTVTTNGTTTYTISLTSLNQFDSNVTLSATGLPSGATATFSPCNANPCTITGLSAGSAGSTLTISVSSSAPAGNYTPAVTATSQGLAHVANIGLNVVDFSLAATPTLQTITAAGSAGVTVSTTALNGFAGTVALSVSGLPPNSSASFVPASVNGAGSSSLNILTSNSTPAGLYTLTITGTSGGITHTATVSLNVQNFSLSVTPASQSVPVGGCATYTVNVAAQNGFSGPVNITVGNLPPGIAPVPAFNPNPVVGSGASTTTICTTSSTPPGNYVLTFTGASGSLSQIATAALAVGIDFQIQASPTSQTVSAGASTTYTINITSINGFSGNVSLSVSGLPAGATPSFNPGTLASPGTSTLTISTLASVAPNTYTLAITGVSGGLTHSVNVTLIVSPPPAGTFSLSASSASLIVKQGLSTLDTITITPQNGFSGNVSLSISGVPDLGSASFTPQTVSISGGASASSSLRILTSSDTPTGTYTLTITGQAAGAPSASVNVNVTVSPNISTGCRTRICPE